MGFVESFRRGWNAFTAREEERFINTPYQSGFGSLGVSSGVPQTRVRHMSFGDKSIISSINTRLGMDVAAVDIRHIRVNEHGTFDSLINSGLHTCLTKSTNIDQTARAFRQDIAMTLFEKGHIAIVAVDTTGDMDTTESYDVLSMRVGVVTQWYPRHVEVEIYNDRKGIRERIVLHKQQVAIVENPLYLVMNEPNSTLQRLIKKLSMLDSVDEQASSGKLDLIFQLPYNTRTETRKNQAEARRQTIEEQLVGSKYGIAYVDATESITQLNRPAENNLLKQVEYLTNQLYVQLGLTPAIFDGTASEAEMLNYHNRTIEPILTAITESIERTFLTKTAISQGQAIRFFRDPFKLVPVGNIAEIADKFTRNEILTSNEVRSIVGIVPSKDPKADELRNSNLNQAKEIGEMDVVDEEIDLGLPEVEEFSPDIDPSEPPKKYLSEL